MFLKLFNILLSVLLLVYILQVSGETKRKSYKGYKLYSIETDYEHAKSLINDMKKFDKELFYEGNKESTKILVKPKLQNEFKKIIRFNNMTVNLLVDDYSQAIAKENIGKSRRRGGKDRFSFTNYQNVQDINRFLRKVRRAYRNDTELVNIGQSFEGRNIVGLRINTRKNQPSPKKRKPVIFLEGGAHAREWICPASLTYFINKLMTSSDPEIQSMKDNYDWHIFPVINPDGYQYSFDFDRLWRKTRSISPRSPPDCVGVDLNRNWAFLWGTADMSRDPCDYELFGGYGPFSEKESIALESYLNNLKSKKHFQIYISFHAYATMILMPYSDSVDHVAPNHDHLMQIGNRAIQFASKPYGAQYEGPGSAAKLLYKISGGSSDWAHQGLGVPISYTIELRGEGDFVWPAERIPEIGEETTQMMLGIVTEAKNLGYFDKLEAKGPTNYC